METTATFQIPSGSEITVRMVNTEEVIELANIYDNQVRLSYELAKRTLVKLDGQAVDAKNREELWGTLTHRDRQFVLMAYNSVNGIPEEETRSFLASKAMIVEG